MISLVALAVAPVLPSCGESFEPPCHVVSRSEVDTADGPAIQIGPVAVTEGSNGETILVSFVRGELVDGGAADGGAASFEAPRARVIVLDADGVRRSTHDFAPPSALAARRGSTGSVGASFTGDGLLFHWQQQTLTTAPDGVTTSSTAVVLQRVAQDGTEAPAVAHPELVCTLCTLDVSFATTSGTTAVIVTTASNSSPGKPPRSALLAFAADGRRIGAVDVTALLPVRAREVPAGGPLGGQSLPAVRLTVQRGLFVARIGQRAALFDATLAPRGGPYELPTQEAELDVDPVTGDVAVVYSRNELTTADAAKPFAVGGLADLVYERYGATGTRAFAPRRVSASFTAIDVRKNGARTGIVHTTGPETFFSLVEENGTKIGGDHHIATPAAGGAAPALGAGALVATFDEGVSRSSLRTPDAAHFVFISSARGVVREVIACEP